jgi:hypothetical protein
MRKAVANVLIPSMVLWASSAALAQADDTGASADAAVDTSVDAPASSSGTWFELHGYARMPLNLETTPREPFLIDSDYFLSGFAYTRLYEPDWTELFLSAHHGNYQVKFGLFASLYSGYATTQLENQFGIAQASVAAKEFLGYEPLSVELGVFWDKFGHFLPYDTYIFGRTHQGGARVRWDFSDRAHVQAGAGIHHAILQQNLGTTPIVHLTGGAPVGPVTLNGYLLRTWTRDQRQLSPIENGTLLVTGLDATYQLPRRLGPLYAAAAYYDADQVLFLAPALEVMHSTGGRGLTENFLGLSDSQNGTGRLYVGALDWPARLSDRIGLRLFGMTTWVRSEQVDIENPMRNKDRRMYLKWGTEPSYDIRRGLRASVRYDRVILDVRDSANSFRAFSPRLSFPLDTWGSLMVQYTRYFYGDKIQLRPGQVPLETMPDRNAFKLQAEAVW